jgi:hypothetical protein
MRYSGRTLVCLLGTTSLSLLPILGCSSSNSGGGTTHDASIADVLGQPDTGHDAAKADAGAKDSAADVEVDAATDAEHDSATDAATDGTTDATVDGEVDGGTDGAVDGAVDGTADAVADAVADAAADAHDAAAPATVLNYFMGRWDQTAATGANAATGVGSVAEWAGSGVITTFTGVNIGVTLTETCNTTNTDEGATAAKPYCDTVTVEIDGVAVNSVNLNSVAATGPSYTLKSGSNTIQVAGLAAGVNHTIGVYKNTDAFLGGKIAFGGFTPAASGTNPKASYTFTHRIEWIGDDITAGTGATGTNTTCATDTTTSNEYDSHARIVSEYFNAERQNLAETFLGAATSYSTLQPTVASTIYPLVLPDEPTSSWTFSSWVPDVVIVNLGSYGDFNFSPEPVTTAFSTPYETAVTSLLATVRAKHPAAYILFVSGDGYDGPLSATEAQTMQQAAVTARGETSATLGFLVLPVANSFACQSRPSASDQQAIATAIEAALKAAPLNWTAATWNP